jgi:DNA-binding winged helix-turn-helix (wHTH) protein
MQGSFKIGEWRVEPNTNRLVSTRIPDQQIRIDPKAMQVLVYLAEHAGQVVRKKEVVDEIWEGMTSNCEVVTNLIWEIRKALSDDAKCPQYIQTIPRKGYRLVAPVKPDADRTVEDEPSYIRRKAEKLLAAAKTYLPLDTESKRSVSTQGVLVVPFTFRGNEQFSYLGEALPDLLGAAIDTSGDLVSMDARKLTENARHSTDEFSSSKGIRRLAVRLGAELYLQGNVVEAAGQIHLRALLHRVDEKKGPVARASVCGNSEELFQLAERLTAQLLASLNSAR